MFERFTDEARRSVAYANQIAQRFGHSHIDTGDMLLGIAMSRGDPGAKVLRSLGLGSFRKLERALASLNPPDRPAVSLARLPQTPRAKRAIEFAIEESASLKHEHVGTEHLLLGLMRQSDGAAVTAIELLGGSPEHVRAAIIGRAEPR